MSDLVGNPEDRFSCVEAQVIKFLLLLQVEVSGVDVRWLCKGFTRAGSEKDALDSPPRHVEGEQLKRYV